MRNLKRALSLTLASVMVASMMVVGAGAASYDDFSDKDKIANKEAVQMLVELGVINGKDDGNYDPSGIVTRAEMAKMICIVLNGGKDPNLGTTVTNTYTDTVGHWASGYIEYCTQLGIVAGDGTGKFNPNATVTGSEAAKMLLVALGYKSEIEGFTGANWALAVNTRGSQKGLYNGLNIVVDQGLTRDNAAQMVYNALDAKVVEYSYTLVTDGSSLSSSPTLKNDGTKTLLEDKFNAVKVEGIVVANEVANLTATSEKGSSLDKGKTSLAITNGDDQNAYTGTKTFSVSTDINDLGRSVVVYVKKDSNSTKAEVLGSAITSIDNKVVVDNSGDSISAVASDNKLTINADTKVAVNYGNLEAYSKYTDPKTAGIEKILVDTDADGDVDYVLMNTYAFGKVTTYTTSGDGSIAISAGNYALSASDKADVVGFDKVAKNDYVLAAYIGGNLHVMKADSVVGTLEAYKGTNPATKLTVAGTNYNVSAIANVYEGGEDDVKAAKSYGSSNLDNEATFYLDKNGYIVAVGNVSENAYNYALVMAKGTTIDERVKVALPDGTTGTYTLSTSGNGLKLADISVGKVYGYSINSNKEIKLTAATTDGVLYNRAAFTKGKTTISGNPDTSFYANKNTVFFYTPGVVNTTVNDVDVYAGYDKAPTLNSSSNASVQVYTSGTRVVAVVFTGRNLTTANVSDNLYIASVGTSTNSYTNAKAFIAGDTKLAEIKVEGTVSKGVYTYTINSDGYYVLKSVPSGNGGSVTLDNAGKTQYSVATANNDTFVLEKNDDKSKMELSITSKTLLVDTSDYLDDPIAEMGAGPDANDKIAYVVYNLNNNKADEALLIVVKNTKTTSSSTSSDNSYGNVTGTAMTGNNTTTQISDELKNNNVIINSDLDLTSNNGTISVPAGKTLVVNGDLKVDNNNKIANSGTVIVTGTYTVGGNNSPVVDGTVTANAMKVDTAANLSGNVTVKGAITNSALVTVKGDLSAKSVSGALTVEKGTTTIADAVGKALTVNGGTVTVGDVSSEAVTVTGGALTIKADTVATSGNYTVSGGALKAGKLHSNSTLTVSGGTANVGDVTGELTISGGASATVANAAKVTLTKGTLTVKDITGDLTLTEGTLNLNGAAKIVGATVDNKVTVNLGASAVLTLETNSNNDVDINAMKLIAQLGAKVKAVDSYSKNITVAEKLFYSDVNSAVASNHLTAGKTYTYVNTIATSASADGCGFLQEA